MSDRERMIEVIESFANGVDFIEVIQCGALADRLIKAGFSLTTHKPCQGCLDSQLMGPGYARPHTCGIKQSDLK